MARKNDYIQAIDEHIGNKIYSERISKGLSRQQLAKVIGVTHQQLQKYEKGVNRISVGRLVLIAKALAKNTQFFYEGIDDANTAEVVTQSQRMCIEASRNFMKLPSKNQEAVNHLMKALIKSDSKSAS